MNGKKIRIATLAGLLAIFLVSWFSAAQAATAPKGPESTACLECHDGYDKTLAKTVHRLGIQGDGSPMVVQCVSCHSGGDQHITEPSRDNITNPANLSGDKALTLCSECHVPHPEMDNYGLNAHDLQKLNCASCHSIHSGTPTLMRDAKSSFCLDCHSDAKSQFMRRSAHPVLQGAMTCLSCHSFVRQRDNAQAYDANRVCQSCHMDVTGPFPYEHAVVTAYAADGNGCVECHNPHGSEQDHLLKQPGNQICLQCHSISQHNTFHNGAYANLACITCHTDLHGSYSNQALLDPNLGAKFGKSCYCHGLN